MEEKSLNQDEREVFQLLKEAEQLHLIKDIEKHTPEERKSFVDQIRLLNRSYPGGIKAYSERAKKLLKDAQENANPYEGFTASVPKGHTIDFTKINEIDELESIGLQELKDACFVLVAGGLGERLGYNGIKVGIPVELVTKKTFLQYYCEYILAFEKKTGASEIPLAIMVSEGTNEPTKKLLKENNYFGLKESQVSLMKQENVPAMTDSDAHFAQTKNSLMIETKPHGHGDVHTLLYMTGLVRKWKSENKKWVIFFQDTNALVFRTYPAILGVSKKLNLEVNSITVPRKPGEAVGAICQLNGPNGRTLTINVEYNQLEPLMKAFGGEPVDSQGYSLYPGNINSLVYSLPEYNEVLEETSGLIAEFINPKYTDSTKKAFKSPTRLECMMQDYPKLLKSANRVGFTQLDRKYCFSACKNHISTIPDKIKANLPPECAASCEYDMYWLNAEILRLAGAEIEHPDTTERRTYHGFPLNFGAKIVLHPMFGVTIKEIRNKLKGKVRVSSKSTLILNDDIELENFILDGSLELTANIRNVDARVKNYVTFEEIDVEGVNVPEYLKIRGYNTVGIKEIKHWS